MRTDDTPVDGPFTAAGGLLLLAATACVFADAGILTSGMSKALAPSAGHGLADARFMWPHVALVAIAGAGFRRTAALIAVVGSPFAVYFGGVLALFAMYDSLAGPFVLFTLLHVVMLIAGLFELRARHTPFFNERPRRRWWGVVGAGLAWSAATGMVVSRNVTENGRRLIVAHDSATAAAASAHFVRTAWMGRGNFGDLTLLARCIEEYRGDTIGGPYPRTLAPVQRWATASPSPDPYCRDLFVAAGAMGQPFGLTNHSRVYYQPPVGRSDPWRATGFSLELEALWTDADEPVTRNAVGTRSYLVDVNGAVHVTAEHRRATRADATLPACAPFAPSRAECHPYVPRHRWGRVTYLPTGGLGGPDSVRLGDTTVFSLHFGGVIPSDSIRSFAIDWGERGSRTSQTVPASKSFAQLPNEVQFFFHRTFQDTGVHRIRGGITTRDGTLYQYADSFRVYGGTRLSGQTGVDSAGHLVTGGMMAQLRQALENMRRELARQGEPMDNLQRCQVSVADMNDWHRESDEVFSSYFTYGKGPGLSVQEGWNMPKGVRIVLDCTARPR